MDNNIKKKALLFILLISISSLFCDMTHAGAKSIYGAYLNFIGASAAAIGFVSGMALLVANSLSLLTGYIASKMNNYWTMTILGYLFCLIFIPALALTSENGWIIASCLIICERVGKACWQPSRSTLVSYATSLLGTGKTFSILSFFNKIGACIGPLILFFILLGRSKSDLLNTYHLCFLVLLLPAIIAICFVLFAKSKFQHPENFEQEKNTTASPLKSSTTFILFCIGISLFGLGFFDFPLITLRLSKIPALHIADLPLFFSGAMLVSAFSSLLFGKLFDKIKLKSIIISTALSCLFPFFLFCSNNVWLLIIGILVWGIGIGSLETILKSVVTQLVAKENRSKCFGLVSLFFGLSLFIGSWLCGIFYDISFLLLSFFSFGMQLLAVVFFFICNHRLNKG